MKIALFDDYRFGLVSGDRIIDVSEAVGDRVMSLPPVERLPGLITAFNSVRDRMKAVREPSRALSDVRLRAPVPRPQKMLFAQGNYMEFTEGPALPLNMFLKLPSSVLEPGGTVRLTTDDAFIFHHEAELAVIIGCGGKDIPSGHALDHVFGYSGLVDVSARGIGRGLDLADKSPDTFCPLGPWITTADEIEDPQALGVRLSVNGQLRQDYNTSDMEHPVRELVAFASSVLTLEPGDVIACGTNHQGLGPIQHGEIVTLEVEKVGALTFKVEDPLQRRWPVGIDRGIGKAVLKMRLTGDLPNPDEAFPVRPI